MAGSGIGIPPKIIYPIKSQYLWIEMKPIYILLLILFCFFSIAGAQSNLNYVGIDPAIKEMLTSIDTPKPAANASFTATSADPAVKEMLTSIGIARASGNASFTSTSADPAVREMLISMDMPRYAGNVPVEIISGSWQLSLSEGRSIELELMQSGSAAFGKGIMVNSTHTQEAFASGSVSGSSLNLEVVPESASELYALSIDITRLPYKGTYVVFLAGSVLQTGTITASKNESI